MPSGVKISSALSPKQGCTVNCWPEARICPMPTERPTTAKALQRPSMTVPASSGRENSPEGRGALPRAEPANDERQCCDQEARFLAPAR